MNSGGEQGKSGPNPSYGTSFGWWVILPRRLVYEFTATHAARELEAQGARSRPMQAWSLALKVEQLLVIQTFWVAISVREDD